VLFDCLTKHHTPVLASDLVPQSRTTYAADAPYVHGPHSLSVERLAPALVRRLLAQRYFSGWSTSTGTAGTAPVHVGVLYMADDHAYLRSTTKALGAAGVRPVETFGYTPSLTSISSEMASAVLRFRSDGVTHVLVEEGSALLFFAQAAQNQGFRPRYVQSTLDGTAALMETGAFPTQQLMGALGAGYLPLVDVGSTGPAESTATAACRDLMRRAGQDTSSPTAFVYMTFECDAGNLLVTALRGQAALAPESLHAGLARLGSSFVSAAVPRMTWTPSAYDAVSAMRVFRFDGSRFVYDGPLHEV
jgi:hypothetical protein